MYINICVDFFYFIYQSPPNKSRSKGIFVEAYAPMGAYPRSLMLDDAVVKATAQKYNKSVGQIALRWELQKGCDAVLPRSKTPEHMQENIDVFDFTLAAEDVEALGKLPQKKIYATQCQPWC